MSNSPLVTYTKISPNSTNPRNHVIDTITIHHIAGVLTAKQIANLTNFTNPKYESSCNYAVGNDGSIALVVEEKNRSWCTSSRENDHRAITIEVSNSKKGDPWPVSDKALEATIELCVDICKRNNIAKINFTGDKTGNLTMHKWFAATGCPGPYLSEKFPYIAQEINKRLGVKEEAPAPTPVEKRELHLGDKGDDVLQLQKDLIELGYNLGFWGADGDFGNDTDKAVRAFQKKNKLDVDGWVGKNTYAAIEKALVEKRKPAPAPAPTPAPTLVELQLGSKGPEVIELQKKLLKLNYDLSPWGADGDFGQKTDAAVRAFQKKSKLDVDGIVGPNTYAALEKALTQTQNVPFLAKVNVNILNVRKGPGSTYPVALTIRKNEIYTIVAEENGWGKLKSGAGWIDLKHTIKV